MRSFLLVAVALIAPHVVSAAPGKTPCETSPRLVGKCFRVHGRLLAYNGTPTFRVWPVGTHRLLGVNGYDGGSGDTPDPRPEAFRAATLKSVDLSQTYVYGDYLLCPFTRSRPGWMQFVCIAKASHLVAKSR